MIIKFTRRRVVVRILNGSQVIIRIVFVSGRDCAGLDDGFESAEGIVCVICDCRFRISD